MLVRCRAWQIKHVSILFSKKCTPLQSSEGFGRTVLSCDIIIFDDVVLDELHGRGGKRGGAGGEGGGVLDGRAQARQARSMQQRKLVLAAGCWGASGEAATAAAAPCAPTISLKAALGRESTCSFCFRAEKAALLQGSTAGTRGHGRVVSRLPGVHWERQACKRKAAQLAGPPSISSPHPLTHLGANTTPRQRPPLM